MLFCPKRVDSTHHKQQPEKQPAAEAGHRKLLLYQRTSLAGAAKGPGCKPVSASFFITITTNFSVTFEDLSLLLVTNLMSLPIDLKQN